MRLSLGKKKFFLISFLSVLFLLVLGVLTYLAFKSFTEDDLYRDLKEYKGDLTREDLIMLEKFYITECEESSWKIESLTRCFVKSLDRAERKIEVEECRYGEDGSYYLAEQFLIECYAPSRAVNRAALYYRAREEKENYDYELLEKLNDAVQEDLAVSDSVKFDLIEESIGEYEVLLRLIRPEGEEPYVNVITFFTEDLSLCNL